MLIEPILGYKSTWRILELLLETPQKLVSRTDLFKHTHLGNAPLSKGLNRLVKAGIIIKHQKGKKEFYYINLDNNYTKFIKELWETEKKDIRFLDYDIKTIISEFLRMLLDLVEVKEVILFGSWAKGTASTMSDIDLAIVFEKDHKGEIEVTRITRAIETKFSKEIQVHYFTEKSFSKKSKLIEEIKKDGIWMLNKEHK